MGAFRPCKGPGDADAERHATVTPEYQWLTTSVARSWAEGPQLSPARGLR